MPSLLCRLLLLATAFFVPAVSHSQAAAPAPGSPADAADLEWLHGAWNIVYEDAVLGPVHGRAIVGSGRQGLEAEVRFRDPRTNVIHSLRLAASAGARLDSDEIELKLEGNSPPSGYVDPPRPGSGNVLQVPSGTQVQARLEGAPPAYVIVRPADPDPPLADRYLSLRIPIAPGARESLAPEWSYWIHRPGDMATSRAGAVTERGGARLVHGIENWSRPAATVTAATDLDLPSPARLAALHKDRRLPGGKGAPTPERAALQARWGPDTYAVTWLRIDGVDLPVQPMRQVRLDFEDAGIVWTGAARPDESRPESLNVQVQLLKGITAGPKWFTLNGAAGHWDYGVEPVAIRHLRSLAVPGIQSPTEPDALQFEVVDELYLGEVFFVEVKYPSEPSFATRIFASRAGNGVPVRYETKKLAGQRTLFRSGPLLLEGSASVDPAPEEASTEPVAAAIAAMAGTSLRTEEPDAMAPSRGRTVGLTRIVETPPSLWNRAMQKAASCRRSGNTPTEISRRIVTAGFEKRSLAVSLEDHAAALLLRDELARELTRYADSERRALARGGSLHAAYTAQLISEARALGRPAITDLEVHSPDNQELLLLRTALGEEMERRWFKGNDTAFFDYATRAVAAARRELADRAWSTADTVERIDDCDVERILGTVRSGLGPVVANVQRRLLRRPRGGEPSVPRWVPDRVARSHVASLGVLAEAIKALTEYSSADTDVVIAAATAVTLGGGGLAGMGGKLATDLGREAAGQVLGQIATGAAWTGVALDVADLGLTANDFAQYSEALAEVKLAEGLATIGGDERLRQAREDAENKAFGLALSSTVLAGGASVTGVQVARTSKATAPIAEARPDAIPASPEVAAATPATPSAEGIAPSVTTPPTKGRSGGVLDRPEFRNIPDKPPAEAPDLDSFMTPEERAAQAASGQSALKPAPGAGPDSSTAATVLESGRPLQDRPGSAAAGPTDTVIDRTRPRPDAAGATPATGGEEFSVDLDRPGGVEKMDERIAAERRAADSRKAAGDGDGFLDRPEFGELPDRPPAESPDLDAYRSPEELAERKRLSTMDTTAMPPAQSESVPAAAASPDATAPPPVSQSRIARSNEDTFASSAGTETKTRLPGADPQAPRSQPDSRPSAERPVEIEDRYAGPDEDTGIMTAVPDSRAPRPRADIQPPPERPVDFDDHLAGPDETTVVLRPEREPGSALVQPEEFDPTQPIEGFDEPLPRGKPGPASAGSNDELKRQLARRTERQQARDRLDEARVAQLRAEIEEAQRLGRFEDAPGVTGITAPPMRGPNDGMRPHRQLIPGDSEYLDNIMYGRAASGHPGGPATGRAPVLTVAPERLPLRPDGTAWPSEVGPLARGQNDIAAHLVNDYVRRILTEPTFPRSRTGEPIEILLDDAGDFVGGAGHHRLIAAVIASRLTGRPLYGAPHAIIPENAIAFRNAADSGRADTARTGWRMGVNAPLDDGSGALLARINATRDAAEDLRNRATAAARNGDTSGAERLRLQAAQLDWQAGVERRGLRDEEPPSSTRIPSPPQPAPPPQSGSAPRRIDRSVAGERYYVSDSSNPRFVASGEVYELRNELSIQIRTELEDGTRSQVLRGAEEFDRIIAFFRGKFTSIRANWLYGSNLAKVNELTGPPNNLSLGEAVTRTWTAGQARKAGFPNAANIQATGTPGHYTTVQVSFTR